MKNSLNLWLLIVVAVCGLSYCFGKDLLVPPSQRAGTEPEATAPLDPPPVAENLTDGALPGGEATAAPMADVHVAVLNGTPEPGLARDFGLLLGQAGWVVEQVHNAPHDHFAQTVVVNRLLTAARAEKLAADLGGVPVLLEFDRRSDVDALVVLGRDAEQVREHLAAQAGP